MKVEIGCGFGFIGTLTLVFVIFKILGYIDWSWIWVFSPILITTLAVLLVVLLIIFIIFIIALIQWLK